ncbi:conserved hypothetical protein [Burkholderiales bacterium 8X]|nr:conserved hypothetical protein [Burkholderiales bacterium 8X]
MRRRAARIAFGAIGLLAAGYVGIALMVWMRARERLAHPPRKPADAALVFGNRAYLKGRPNPCLTGRVDTGVALAAAGLVPRLVMTGGLDREDGRIEAEVMARQARAAGFQGELLLEPVSASTRENLSMSRPVLQAAGVKRVILVSEPYHLWRIERLVRASGFDRLFEVDYAAAPSSCWQSWGMLYRGALREPFAIVNNAANGYLR